MREREREMGEGGCEGKKRAQVGFRGDYEDECVGGKQ